jgi:RND family efflux transporter MFP subunit
MVPIVAPTTGTVIERKITPGSVVEPGEEVFTISELTTVWMMASVNETDISKLRVGNCARVITQAFPNVAFTGRVQRLGTELDPQTRTLQVRIVVPNPGLKLRPAMYANAQIDEGSSTSSFFVPEEAVQDINGSAVVFVRLNSDTFETRAVQIAQHLNGEAQISAGLRSGDQVVVKGSFVVKSDILKSQIGE